MEKVFIVSCEGSSEKYTSCSGCGEAASSQRGEKDASVMSDVSLNMLKCNADVVLFL